MLLKQAFWEQFQTYLYIERKLSDNPSSKSSDKSRFKKLVRFFDHLGEDFTKDNFNLFIADMKAKGNTVSYMNHLIQMAKHLDKWLKLNNLQDYTYFKESRNVRFDILNPSEIEQLANVQIKYAKHNDYINQRQKVLIMLLGTTGCRIGEALSLRFDSIFSNPPYVVFFNTKNGDDRQVPIGKELYNNLISLPRKSILVFVSGRGGKLECQQVNLDLKVRAKMMGIKKRVWAHLFRHSYITTMLEMGVDSLDVAVIVGHKDPKSTLRYKNSLIGHYANIIHMHPLLKANMPWETCTARLKDYLNKVFDPKNHSLSITEEKDKIEIVIKRDG